MSQFRVDDLNSNRQDAKNAKNAKIFIKFLPLLLALLASWRFPVRQRTK